MCLAYKQRQLPPALQAAWTCVWLLFTCSFAANILSQIWFLLAFHWETHLAFSRSVLIRPAIGGSPVNTAQFGTGGHSAGFIPRAVCYVCLCCPFFTPCLLSSPPRKGRTQPPQASIHLPSLTLGEAIKLLLPDLGGEKKKKNSAQGNRGGQRDSESEPSISQAKEKQ